MFVCLRMQCPSVQCGCGNRNGLWCVPQHLVLEDWEVPQWDNSWEPRSSWIPFAKLTMEIHGRFSLPKMIHDDLYVEKNMRIYIYYVYYIYIQYIETRVNVSVSVSVWVWVCVWVSCMNLEECNLNFLYKEQWSYGNTSGQCCQVWPDQSGAPAWLEGLPN